MEQSPLCGDLDLAVIDLEEGDALLDGLQQAQRDQAHGCRVQVRAGRSFPSAP
ncbi:MAG: hypothetical protein RI885_288 [Actinomycetota bacterium]